MSNEDRVVITIYHYNDTNIGHANYSISGTINGTTYDNDIIVGVNLDEGEKGTSLAGVANAFLGKGHIRDESHYPKTRDHTKTVIVLEGDQLTNAVKTEALRQIKEHEKIKEEKPKETNFDLLPHSDGTHCYEFLVSMLEGSGDTPAPDNAQSPGLGINLLEHIDGKSLTATEGGRAALGLIVDNQVQKMENEAKGPRKKAITQNRNQIRVLMLNHVRRSLGENPDATYSAENFNSVVHSMISDDGTFDVSAFPKAANNLTFAPSGNTERFNDRASSVRAGTAIYEDIQKDNTPWWQGVDPLRLDKGENPAFTDELKHLRGLDPDMSADECAQSETGNLIKQGVESGLDLLPESHPKTAAREAA